MKPLVGMRVVDLADEKGELCGRLLADLGAEVIRVEPPEGALSRSFGPFAADGETSLYFAHRNAGKRGLTLDLTSEDGQRELKRLLANADALIESTRPGTLGELGLGASTLRVEFPHLVITSISDFGQDGPYADYQGTNMVGVAMGGMLHRAGIPTKPPVMIPGHLAYDVAGIAGAQATLLAFWQRFDTGRGQHLDVSTMDATAALSDWSLSNYSLNPQLGKRDGPGIYPLYRCADGFMRMIVLVPKHWRALLDWIGRPEKLCDPKYEQFINRLIDRDMIKSELEGFFADKKKVEVALEAQRRGITSTPLLRAGEVLENEHTVGRGTFHDLEVAPGVEARFPSGFFTLNNERTGPTRSAPTRQERHDAFENGDDHEALLALIVQGASGAPGTRLSRLRVIDCGIGAVGVEAGRFFSDFGADVIKIESSDAPDFIRVIMSSYMNPSFISSNHGKRSFGVDLSNEKGRALVERLLEDADLFIENNSAGTMDKLGLGAADLARINPRLVSLSSQSLGSYGPWHHFSGYGPNTHAVSGLQYLWNYPEDEAQPAGSTAVHPDHIVGRIGVVGLLAGLIGRERSGKGSHFDAAQFEVPIGLMGDLFAKESLEPGSVRPVGNASHRGAPWSCLPCAGEDEWCVINVRSDAEWEALRTAIGTPEWSNDPAYSTAEGRIAARETIDEALAVWTREREPREVMETLQAAGVPAGIVAHPGHHMGDPQLAHRGYAKLVAQPDFEAILVEGQAFISDSDDLPEIVGEPAPLLGEHTREVASTLLGLSEAEIDALIEEGAIEDPPKEFKLL